MRYLRRALWPLLGTWLLLHPPRDFRESWIILDSAPTRWECEEKRADHPRGQQLICAEVV